MAFGLMLVHCAGAIVVPEENRELTPEEIRSALLSDDFRIKNKAREQLGKLPVDAQFNLLTDVLSAGDSATRTLAIVELAKMGTPASLAEVERVSKEDADADVREMAQMLLEGDDDSGAVDDEGGDDEGDEPVDEPLDDGGDTETE